MGNTLGEEGVESIRRSVLPWKQTSREKEQRQFIERWKRGEVSFVSLCRQFGISRKMGYKREDRFQRYGWEGLGDWSLTPRRRPNRTPLAVSERLIEVRRAYPNWGPKKVVAWLRTAEPEGSWPAPEHGRGRPGPSRAGATSETSTPCGALERTVCCSGEPQ